MRDVGRDNNKWDELNRIGSTVSKKNRFQIIQLNNDVSAPFVSRNRKKVPIDQQVSFIFLTFAFDENDNIEQ